MFEDLGRCDSSRRDNDRHVLLRQLLDNRQQRENFANARTMKPDKMTRGASSRRLAASFAEPCPIFFALARPAKQE